MSELQWTDHEWNGLPTGAKATGKRHWDIAVWGGTKKVPSFSLAIVSGSGSGFIIAVDQPTIPGAKEMAQRLDDVLSGNVADVIAREAVKTLINDLDADVSVSHDWTPIHYWTPSEIYQAAVEDCQRSMRENFQMLCEEHREKTG